MAVSRDEVVWAYRLILGREPESEDAVRATINKHDRLPELRQTFLRSHEFKNKYKILGASPFLPLNLKKNEIEYDATEVQLAECLAKIKAAWSHLGNIRPHFSVLTNKQFLPGTFAQHSEAFWLSGEQDAARAMEMLARHDFVNPEAKSCLEYGCGVGRVTMALAKRFALVIAYDISEGHLSLAERRAQEVGVFNCRFQICPDRLITSLSPCDFFFSRIVFQHNPPPVIYHLIKNALRALNPDGIAIFQVPTYRIGYRFSINEWLSADHALDMQMHCIPQEAVFQIVADEKCVALEVREDNSTGAPNQFISNTFIVRKSS